MIRVAAQYAGPVFIFQLIDIVVAGWSDDEMIACSACIIMNELTK